MTCYIAPYMRGSGSADKLAKALGVRKAYKGLKPRVVLQDIVINWGRTLPMNWRATIVNPPHAVAVASNKYATFRALDAAHLSIPSFSTSMEDALPWVKDGIVFGRQLVTSHSGKGIVVCRTEDEIKAAEGVKLWVKYIKKDKEQRVHVMLGEILDVQEKRKSRNRETTGTLIRNTANGYVFCREGVEADSERDSLALAAAQALGLDFAALDLIRGKADGKWYVLEANTAPGLEGTTLLHYETALRRLVNEHHQAPDSPDNG